jgi:hypothetical protein
MLIVSFPINFNIWSNYLILLLCGRVELSVIISQESENKLKIIRQIFENLLPSGNKVEKESGELFSIYSHSRGVFGGLFFHEYKIKNTKKNIQ